MSGKIMGQVWDLELAAPKRIVLLAMADHADHNGDNVYPSTPLIAWKTDYSERQVRRIVDDLVTDGLLIIVEERSGKPTKYRIALSNGKQKEPFKSKQPLSKCQGSTKKTPDIQMSPLPLTNCPPEEGITPDIQMSPEPYLKEPSVEPAAPKPPQPQAGESVTPTVSKKAAAAAVYEVQTERYALAFRAYEECFGLTLNPTHAQMITAYIDDDQMPTEWIVDAFQEAVDNNVRKWTYVRAILENWRKNGRAKQAVAKENPAGWTWGHEAYKLIVPGLHPNVIIKKAQSEIKEALEKAWRNAECRKLLIDAGLGDKMTAKFGGVS